MKLYKLLLPVLLMVASLWVCTAAHAVVPSTQSISITAGNGSTTQFTVPFPIPYQPDGVTPAVVVMVEDNLGNYTTLAPSQYTITNVGAQQGGAAPVVTYSPALASGWSIIIQRAASTTQPTAVGNSSFYPHSVETTADWTVYQTQQATVLGADAIKVPVNDAYAGTSAMVVPQSPYRANTLLGFDVNGRPTVLPQSQFGASSGGSPGGSSGQIQYNNSGALGGFTMGGDCTFSQPNITCTKTGGVAFGALATLGSVNNSNWSGTQQSVVNGGTGDQTFTAHGVVVGAGTSALAVTATGSAGQVLTSNGASADPTFQAAGVGTVTSVTCNGGLTGGAITSSGVCSLNSPTAHGVLVGEGASAIAATAVGTSGQVLTSNGAGSDPTFQAVAGTGTVVNCNGGLTGGSSATTCSLNSPTAHGVLIGQGSSAIAATSAGTSGYVLTSNGASADPTWQVVSGTGTVTSVTCNGGLTGGTFTTVGTCSLGSPTSHGVLVGAGASAISATGAGLSGQCLESNGASADPSFQTCGGGGAPGGASNSYQYNASGSLAGGGLTYVNANQSNIGPADAASPAAQTWGAQNVLAGTTNVVGAKTVYQAGNGTGNKGSGQFCIDTALPGSSGSSADTFQDAMCWDNVAHPVTGGGTPSCGSHCGSVSGNDSRMVVTQSGSASLVTVNFAKAWSSAPVCLFSPVNSAAGGDTPVITSTTTSLTIAGATAVSPVWNVSCSL